MKKRKLNNQIELKWLFQEISMSISCIEDFICAPTAYDCLEELRNAKCLPVLVYEMPTYQLTEDCDLILSGAFSVLAKSDKRDCQETNMDTLVRMQKAAIEIQMYLNWGRKDAIEFEWCVGKFEFSKPQMLCDVHDAGIWGWRIPFNISLKVEPCIKPSEWSFLPCPELVVRFTTEQADDDGNVTISVLEEEADGFAFCIYCAGVLVKEGSDYTLELEPADFMGENGKKKTLEIILKAWKFTDEGCCIKYGRLVLQHCKGMGQSYCWTPPKDEKRTKLLSKPELKAIAK